MGTRRRFILAVAFCSLGVGTFIPRQDAAEDPKVETVGLIRISKQTTHITDPRDEKGYVDYQAAINKKGKQGVTPANNAGVPIWQAFGRQDLVPDLVPHW